jgi:hypothetical protein
VLEKEHAYASELACVDGLMWSDNKLCGRRALYKAVGASQSRRQWLPLPVQDRDEDQLQAGKEVAVLLRHVLPDESSAYELRSAC